MDSLASANLSQCPLHGRKKNSQSLLLDIHNCTKKLFIHNFNCFTYSFSTDPARICQISTVFSSSTRGTNPSRRTAADTRCDTLANTLNVPRRQNKKPFAFNLHRKRWLEIEFLCSNEIQSNLFLSNQRSSGSSFLICFLSLYRAKSLRIKRRWQQRCAAGTREKRRHQFRP